MQYLSQKLTLIMDKQIEIGIHEFLKVDLLPAPSPSVKEF
jgi:hypothetical protein